MALSLKSPALWLPRALVLARPRRWGLVVTVLTLVANLALSHAIRDARPEADGKYNWLYARSLAFDHDIDFTNDYRICGDYAHHNRDRGGGHPDNPFYVGPSIFWVPAIEVARAFLRFGPRAPAAVRAGCVGPIVTFALDMGSVAAALLIWLSYCAARRLAEDYAAGLAAGLFAFGTTLSAYAAYYRSYSHVYDGACVAALLLLSLRAHEKPDRLGRWALAGLAVAACMLHRLTNGPLGLLPATFALFALYREPKRLALALATITVPAALLGLAPMLLIYKYLYGHYLFEPQGPYFFQAAHGHPWILLFAPKGLFFLAPVAWLSVAGAVTAVWPAREVVHRKLLLTVAAMFAIELYICACPLDWDARSTLGARRLIAFFPFLTYLAAPVIAAMTTWFSASVERVRGLVLTALFAPLALLFLGTGLVVTTGGHNYDYYPSQASTYGGAIAASLDAIDRVLGGVAMLPGQIVFCLRYHAPHEKYWEAMSMTFFDRDQWKMNMVNARLNLGDGYLRAAMPGWSRVGDHEGRLRGRGALVFCAEWPFATELSLSARATTPMTLRVSRRTFFGRTTPYGTISLTAEEVTYKLPIPPGGFDSGIVELVFETEGPGTALIQWVELADQTVYPPVQ